MTSPRRPNLTITVRDTSGRTRSVTIPTASQRFVIGRDEGATPAVVDLELADRHVSRRHCVIAWDDARAIWTLADMKSANGTTINSEPLGDVPVPLRRATRVTIGATLLLIDVEAAVGGDESEATEDPTVRLDGRRPATPVEGSFPDGDAETERPDMEAPTVNLRGGAAARPVASSQTLLLERAPAARPAPAVQSVGQGPSPSVSAGPEAVILDPHNIGADPVGPLDRRETVRTPDEPVLGGIARILVESNLLEAQKAVALARIARETGRTFFRTLAEDTSIRLHQEIYEKVAATLGLEQIDNERSLMERAVPTQWLSFPAAFERGAVMLSSSDETVAFATVDPYDIALDDWIARCSNRKPRKILVSPTNFAGALLRLKNPGTDDEGTANVLVIDISAEDEQRISSQSETIDAPQRVNYFLQRAFLQGASDIHIEPTEDYLLVRNRVDGILHEDTFLPVAMHPEIASRIKIIAGMDVAEKRRPQDGRISSIIQGNSIDVRVSSYPTIYGEKVVMRLLDKNALRPSAEKLGMLDRDRRMLIDKLGAPFGLIMISGPTGSGKTTTLYSCLSSIDKKSKNVLTVEDPVEYRLRDVHQMQVNDRIGLTFASGLRTILRQDPDVIMVGECRDTETAAMAIQASLTGHIVFSTIHTNDAIGVITRLLDMGIDHFLVANALTLCIAQRLVRRICTQCGIKITGTDVRRRLQGEGISAERLEALGIDIDGELTYMVGVGCVHCRNTGYQGREAVFEVFEMNNSARNMIMSPDFNADELRRSAKQAGMTTLIGHGLQLIEDGVTTHAEVIRVLGEAY